MTNTGNQEFAIADEVWHRVVQIVQEAMLMGVDCADLLRQIRVSPNESQLVLTPAYNKMIAEHHAQLVAEAEAKTSQANAAKIIGV